MAISLGNKFPGHYFSWPIIVAGWVYLFRNEFSLLNSQWSQDDFSYCYLVPLVAGYIAWQKRASIAANQDSTTWPGFIGIFLSGVLLLAGRLGSLESFIFLSMWLSIVSVFLVLLGWKAIKQLAFPALLLLFIIPPPAFIERVLSFNLRLLSSSLSFQLLNLLNVPVFLEGNIFDFGTLTLQVVDACSGLRYLLPTIFLSLLVGYILNTRFLSRAILVLISAPVAILLNTIRITITGILVRYISPALAEGFFHDFQGWLIYLGAIALLTIASLALKRLEGPATGHIPPPVHGGESEEKPSSQTTFKHPKIQLAILVSGLFVALSVGGSSFIGAQTVPSWKSLETFPLQVGEWTGTRSYLDKATLDSLWADDYFLASYSNTITGSTLHLFVPYYKIQTAQHTAHAPTSCLLGSGWEIAGRSQLGPTATTGRNFPVQQLILSKNGEQLLSNFWFQQRGRILASELSNKVFLLIDALIMHRSDGALVRVEMVIPRGMTVAQAQTELDAFAAQVESTLRTYLPN